MLLSILFALANTRVWYCRVASRQLLRLYTSVTSHKI
jgi:hypothetical protein